MVFLATDPLPASSKDRSLSGKIPKAKYPENIEYFEREYYDSRGIRDHRSDRRHSLWNERYDDDYRPHHSRKYRSGSYIYQRPDGVYIHWGSGKERDGHYYPRRHNRLREGPYMYQRPDGLYIHWGRDKDKGDHPKFKKKY